MQINNLKSIQGCGNDRIKTQLSSCYVEGLQFGETDVSNFEGSLKYQTHVDVIKLVKLIEVESLPTLDSI